MKKQFSVALLRIGDQPFHIQAFSSIQEEEKEDTTNEDKALLNRKTIKEIRSNRYVLFYFEEGGNMPRQELVYNATTQEEEDNPRGIDQIERNKQTFILIDSCSQLVYMSDFRRKKTFEEWLKTKLANNEVVVKDIIDQKTFLDTIQSVKKIHLCAVPNLFSQFGILSKELTNDYFNYGTGIDSISVTIRFAENKVPSQLKNMIRNLFKQKEDCALHSLEVCGRYDDKFERVFNAEGIVDKVTINITPDENGLLSHNEVFDRLIEEIQ